MTSSLFAAEEIDLPSYWLIVGTAENVSITAALGWTVQGFKSRHGKKAAAMRPGDQLIYYVTGIKAIAAVAQVASSSFESHDLVWRSDARPPDNYPWRVQITRGIVLTPDRYIPVQSLLDRLAFVRKWPPENWTLAFQGNVHLLPFEDGVLLSGLIGDAAGEADPSPGSSAAAHGGTPIATASGTP